MMRRNWIKIYVDQWLRGTLRDELEPAERSVWTDFLAMAGDSPFEGQISFTQRVGYTDEQIAASLKVPLDVLMSAKEKMVKHEKIRIIYDNVIVILNWPKYQSEYRRQKIYRGNRKEEVTVESNNQKLQPKVTTKGYEQERDRERDKKEKKNKKELVLSKDIDSPLSTKTLTQLEFSSPIEKIKLQWNEFAKEFDLSQIKSIEKKSARSASLKARMKEKGFCFADLLETIKNSPFLLGQTKENFHVFFDWIIKPSNYQKIIEGTYLDKKKETYREYIDRKKSEENKK